MSMTNEMSSKEVERQIASYGARFLSNAQRDAYLESMRNLVRSLSITRPTAARQHLHALSLLISERGASTQSLADLLSELSIASWEGKTRLRGSHLANIKAMLRRMGAMSRGVRIPVRSTSASPQLVPPVVAFEQLAAACGEDTQALGALVATAGAGISTTKLRGATFSVLPPTCTVDGETRTVVGPASTVLGQLTNVTLSGRSNKRLIHIAKVANLHVSGKILKQLYLCSLAQTSITPREILAAQPGAGECFSGPLEHYKYVDINDHIEALRG